MSSCCSGANEPTDHPPTDRRCPVSGTKASRVDLQTVKALLTGSALRRLETTQHYFCPGVDCDVVYFDALGRTYSTTDVRVGVWQKLPIGARTICYCFGENEADIRREVQETGTSAAEQRVRGHIAAGRCACEIRNPKGVCCLGDVAAAVKRIVDASNAGPTGSV